MPSPSIRAHLDVTVPLDSLLGVGDEPARLASVGFVGSDVVRDLLADPAVAVVVRRLVADPVTGRLLDVGRAAYAAPSRLREFLDVRDRVCRLPGCRRRAAGCQVDHAVAWQDGGPTSAANLGLLCVRHHQLTTHTGWDIVASAADGSCTWISPQGRRFEHDPP